MPKKYVYDYYQVNVPEDLGDRQQRIQAAFMEAENKSKIWAMPSEWQIMTPMDEFDEVEDILVRRKRRNMRIWYVGLKVGTYSTYEAFTSAVEPTAFSHGDKYSAVIGPFETKRAAMWAVDNPYFGTTWDAEYKASVAS